jgi:hypothetical protein
MYVHFAGAGVARTPLFGSLAAVVRRGLKKLGGPVDRLWRASKKYV